MLSTKTKIIVRLPSTQQHNDRYFFRRVEHHHASLVTIRESCWSLWTNSQQTPTTTIKVQPVVEHLATSTQRRVLLRGSQIIRTAIITHVTPSRRFISSVAPFICLSSDQQIKGRCQ